MTSARKILLAEDDDVNRHMLATVLRKKGFDVGTASNGVEVLEALDGTSDFDVVLLDVMMPVMGGLEALKRFRPRYKDLPVIMLTALAGSKEVVEALELGADDYITKPYDFQVLLARIEARARRKPQPSVPDASTSTIAPGFVVDGRYRLEQQIGAGSYGAVFRARHLTLDTDVAVKILRVGAVGSSNVISPIDSLGQAQKTHVSAEASEDFRREGVRACRVQHENAVRVHDFGHLKGIGGASGLPFLVMELLRGRTLDDEITQLGARDVRRAVEVLVPVTDCLEAAHTQRVIHRDIKPANIFLHQVEAPDAREVVKVVDFGVAKLLDDDKMTRDSIAGSPAYMAPERLRGRPYDGRADVYALGIVLYEMLVGHVPFRSENPDVMAVAMMQLKDTAVPPSFVRPELPALCDRVVAEMLEKNPAARPNMVQARERLKDLLDAV